MNPQLLRRIEILDIAQGVTHLTRTLPAHAYMYGHQGMHEDIVEQLRGDGRVVYRSYSQLYIHPSAADWKGSYQQLLYQLATTNDLFLKDANGEVLTHAVYGGSRIFDWGRVEDEVRDTLTRFILETSGREIRLDNVFVKPEPYMVSGAIPPVTDLFNWRGNLMQLMTDLKSSSDVRLLVNGTNSWEHECPREYEAADTGRQGMSLRETLGRYLQDREGSALELTARVYEPHVIPILLLWRTGGGIVECRDPETAHVAWSLGR